jgi:hypothetical protein
MGKVSISRFLNDSLGLARIKSIPFRQIPFLKRFSRWTYHHNLHMHRHEHLYLRKASLFPILFNAVNVSSHAHNFE